MSDIKRLHRYSFPLFLTSGHNKSIEDAVCDGTHYCNLPIAYRPGMALVYPFPILTPINICTSYFHFSFYDKVYILSQQIC